MKNIFIALFALAGTTGTVAQAQDITVQSKVTGREEVIGVPEGMRLASDSLFMDWQARNYITPGEGCETTSANPVVSDSVYIDRLSRMPTIIEMPYNEVVREFIDLYAVRLREKVSLMLAAANFYVPLFEEALDLYDLPMELKYLPVIESAMDPVATSRQGAVGLWQFMLGTSKIYGLTTNSLVDERRDPVKSTWAAAHYLKDLYDIYHDWNLVLAAYNCGPGIINKAIRRAGGETDYWSIYNYLPKETRGYVPAFIAANYIMTYYCEHGICPMEVKQLAATDTVHVDQEIHLRQIADVCHIDMDRLRSLNPQYKKDIVPGNGGTCILRLPNEMVGTFIDLQDSILAYKPIDYPKKRQTVDIKAAAAPRNASTQGAV